MILLLGKNNAIEDFAREEIKLDLNKDLIKIPEITDHYTELDKYIEVVKLQNPKVVTTQSLDLIDVLLNSELDFNVVTVVKVDNDIRVRDITKTKAKTLRYEYGLELR